MKAVAHPMEAKNQYLCVGDDTKDLFHPLDVRQKAACIERLLTNNAILLNHYNFIKADLKNGYNGIDVAFAPAKRIKLTSG